MRTPAIIFAMLTSSVPALSQEVDVPLTNWTVPPYAAASSGGMQVMTDISGPRAFIPLRPCRVADTRGNAAPIQGGIFGNSEARNWTVTGICGIPSGADAISVNFTVVSAPATPQGGFLLAWPTGSPPVQTTAIMTYGPGVTVLSNAAIVPLNVSGFLTINVSHSTHIIMDVNGYFSDRLGNPANGFELINNSDFPTIRTVNQSTTCPIGCALFARAESGTVIFAEHTSDASPGHGIFATSNSAHPGSVGVEGTSLYTGVRGVANEYLNAAGVVGQIHYTTFANYAFDPAGVRGQIATTFGIGVLGISQRVAVDGHLVNSSGNFVAEGRLGTNYGIDPDASPPWAVFGQGNIGASGMKYFLDPHPTDPRKVIGYIALEGPEAGTYFRGRARFQRGLATIAVPDDFRLVTDAEGLTVQVTPIGEMASFAVVRMGLDEIVVKASRDVEFSYLVQGVRATWARRPPIFEDGVFIPQRPESRMPEWLTPEQQRRLVQNGTYRPDGTVNAETARSLGWERAWEERSRPTPQSPEP